MKTAQELNKLNEAREQMKFDSTRNLFEALNDTTNDLFDLFMVLNVRPKSYTETRRLISTTFRDELCPFALDVLTGDYYNSYVVRWLKRNGYA